MATAYYLSRAGIKNIWLLDERPPLSFTSDRSTECYRNWWPNPDMLSLMNRSIDLMESLANESGNIFRMNRRGYLYVTADETKVPELEGASRVISELGAGPLRVHNAEASGYQPSPPEGFHNSPEGADLLLGNALILAHFPYLTTRLSPRCMSGAQAGSAPNSWACTSLKQHAVPGSGMRRAKS